MGRITERSIEELKSQLDITKVVERYVPLKKNMACCPFHEEKSPSFSVKPSDGIFKCFGCGEGGDAVSFVMKKEGLEYPAALEILADWHGVILQYEEVTPERAKEIKEVKETKEVGYEFMDLVANWFVDQYKNSPDAIAYLTNERGISEATRELMQIGFAPEGWSNLKDYLVSINRLNDGIKYKLITEKEEGKIFDFYRNRLIFPIRDERNRIVSFGGRALGEDKAKWLNGPATILYSKDTVLYGAPNWKTHVSKSNKALITEGYLDVCMAIEKGFPYTLAGCGTSFGRYYVNSIKKVLGKGSFMLAMDGDDAGKESMLKLIPLCLKEGILPEVVNLGDLDLDDYLKQDVGVASNK